MTPVLALLLAQTEAGKKTSFLNILWELQPVLTFSVGLLGLVFSIMAYRRSGVRDFRVPLRDFILGLISETSEAAEEGRKLVEENLSGPNGGTKASHRAALMALKTLEIKIDQLQKALQWRKEEVFRAWSEWKNVTTGGAFPVTKKVDLISLDDPRLVAIHDAHSKFMIFLSGVAFDCLHERIPFWKRFKLKR